MSRSKRTPSGNAGRRRMPAAPSSPAPFQLGRRGRSILFLALAAATIGAAVLFWPRIGGESAGPADVTIETTMNGYSTKMLNARAGEPLRVRVINPDTSAHTDGGGWHQLAIPALGIDARIAPRSQSIVEIPGAAPGDYPFYCDVCCGGKENPTMQGTLRVRA